MLKDLNDEQKLNLAFIGRCIKGVVHNVNTPLSAVVGRAEMLQMRLNRIKEEISSHINEGEMEKCLRDVSLIIENSNRVSETIKNVMQKCIRVESDKVESISISNIVKEELDFLQADMDFKHNIEKSYHIDKHVPLINGVYVDFSNSLLEILENCLKAMLKTEKKELSVTVGSTDTFIDVKFHDTGSGIEPKKKKQLLQILQDPSSVSLMESDLGISRVARLLKPYKAQFDIQSKPGDTTFTIKIPCKNISQEEA